MKHLHRNPQRHHRRNDAGFSLLEVLVATLILALAIMLINFSSKQFVDMQEKLQKMENIYLSTLSLKDQLSRTQLEAGMEDSGTINGLEFRYAVDLVDANNNFNYSSDPGEMGNLGQYRLLFYRVSLHLAGRPYEFYLTQSQ